MPTTTEEADKIVELCGRHGVLPHALLKLAKDLYHEVGLKTDNWSLRETTRMLYDKSIDVALSRLHPEDTVAAFMEAADIARPDATPPPDESWLHPRTVSKPQAVSINFNGWLVAYYALVIGHLVLWAGLTTSCVLAILYQPWSVWLPILSFCVYLLTVDTPCPVTRWENAVRKHLGWPEVTHFTHFYLLCPLLHGRTCDKKCQPVRVGPQ